MFDPVEAIKEYVRHPSVSADPAFKEGMDGARGFICNILTEMGLAVECVETPLHPIVLAERKGKPEWPHLVIYGHYDVQPPDPLEEWETPPFEPTERNGKIYGRGAADNKGPQLVHVAAVAKALEENPDLPLRITFLIEGEEEIGSPSFLGFLKKYKERIQGDFVLLSDSLSPSTEQIAITTGLRGVFPLEINVTGPNSDLHSGLHGGAILNPIQALTEVCATLHNADGRVNIDGFYDDVLDVEPWEREQLAKLGKSEKEYADFLGIKEFHTIDSLNPFEATRFMPTLEFNGIGGGYQGEGSKTVIPSKAFAKLSCRLVPNMDPEKITKLIANAIRERISSKVQVKIKTSQPGAPYLVIPPDRPNTPKDQSPILAKGFRAADKAITEVFGKPPLYLREGGSVPIIQDIKRVVGLDSVMIGMFTPESNLHAPNESMPISLFKNGIEASRKIIESIANA